MKVLFVGDVHNHFYMFKNIKEFDDKYNFDRIIFLGDYVDDWFTTNNESLETLDYIIELKKKDPNKYTFCLGNHELSYLGYPCAGHKKPMEEIMYRTLRDNINCFDLYTSVILNNEEYICSHAGITNSYIGIIKQIKPGIKWKEALEIMNNDKLAYLSLLKYVSSLRGGLYEFSSMVWCDKREHEYFNSRERYIIPNQIIGHTPVHTICNIKDDDVCLYFIDTHSTFSDGRNYGDCSYLLWNEDKFEIIK